jgi:hypothetical protein
MSFMHVNDRALGKKLRGNMLVMRGSESFVVNYSTLLFQKFFSRSSLA